MGAVPVEVILELKQFAFEVYGCPEEGSIQELPADRADQPFHERMRQRNIGHRFDFCHIQDSQIGLPPLKEIERILVRAQIFGQSGISCNGATEHAAKRQTIRRSCMHAKADNSARVLVHNDQDPVSSQGQRLTAKQIHAPEAIFHLPQESQPGRATGIWI